MAETYRTPVIILLDEITVHMRESFVMPEEGGLEIVNRLITSVPKDMDYYPYYPREDGRLPMSDFGVVHRYNVTGLVHETWGFPSNNPAVANDLLHHLVAKIENRKSEIARIKEFNLEDAETILISYGASARSALHIMCSGRTKGSCLGMIELLTLWPFPDEVIREKCKNAKYLVVVEMNMGQVAKEVKVAVEKPYRVFLSNRVDGNLITPTDIKNVLNLIQGKGI